MKLFQKLIAAPAIISMASGIAVNAAEINSTDLSDYTNPDKLVSLDDFKSDTLYPGDWAYDSLKDLTNSPKFNGNSVTRLEAAAELNNLIAGGEGLMNGAAIDRLSDELGSELAIMKGRVDGLEARVNGIEAGSFSETTTASFSVDFGFGAVDGSGITTNTTDGNEAFEAGYGFQMDLTTSFTGEDKLKVSVDGGNAAGAMAELDMNGPVGALDDVLDIDGVSYTFPVGDVTVMVGDNTDGSKLFDIACAYKGGAKSLDDCGTDKSDFSGGDTMIAASYDFNNGFTASVGYEGDGSTNGLGTDEGLDAYGINAMYKGDTYGVSVSYANVEATTTSEDNFTGINAYWQPEGFPSISVGYEWGVDGSEVATEDGLTSYFIGVSSDEVGPGKLGAALGTKTPTPEDGNEQLMYELFYAYPVNDGMTITPIVFHKENSTVGTPDETGVLVKTSFSF
jgi:hypothetical protein